MTVQRLKELINRTHKRGVKLSWEIHDLTRRRPVGWRARVALKEGILKTLELLNARRRKELARLEHVKPPAPKPKPRPKRGKRFTMYDSVNVESIPRHAQAVAGYVDGAWPTYNDLLRHFPYAKHLSIAVSSSKDAHCLDIEKGNASPADAPDWVRKQKPSLEKLNRKPTLYANLSTMPEVEAVLKNAGIGRHEVLLYVAHYTNIPHIEPGYDATQWEDHKELYDISLCEPWFL